MKLNNPELLRSQCLINGEWCDALSGKREAVINPATGAELASIPLVSEEETQQAIAAAQRAQNDWKPPSSVLRCCWPGPTRCWPHRKIWRS